MRLLQTMAGLVVLGLALSAPAEENWAQWRGPRFNGSTSAANLPQTLEKGEALWSTPIPGHSNGTPIVFGDRIFITTYAPQLYAYCLSKKDGKILWQKTISEVSATKGRNDSATPSPVTDGKKVIFLFGTGDLAAFDMDGNELWKRNLQKDYGRWNYQWLYGASPLLYKGKLYVQVLHRNVPESNWSDPKPGEALADSYLLALDPESGKEIWKVIRPTDARVESHEAYTTPIPWERPGGTQLLIAGGDCLTGHDPETGKELWRAGGWNPRKENSWRLVASAVTWDGLAFVCPPKGGLVRAFKEGGSGEVTKSHVAWIGKGLTSDAAVPLVYENMLYVMDGDRRQVSCVDPATGEKKWSGTLPGGGVLRASLTAGDGKMYTMNERGDVFVLSPREFKVLSRVSLGGEGSRGSVALVDGLAVIRTGDRVWAFGKK